MLFFLVSDRAHSVAHITVGVEYIKVIVAEAKVFGAIFADFECLA